MITQLLVTVDDSEKEIRANGTQGPALRACAACRFIPSLKRDNMKHNEGAGAIRSPGLCDCCAAPITDCGCTCPTSNFAAGVLAPNIRAAAIAIPAGGKMPFFEEDSSIWLFYYPTIDALWSYAVSVRTRVVKAIIIGYLLETPLTIGSAWDGCLTLTTG